MTDKNANSTEEFGRESKSDDSTTVTTSSRTIKHMSDPLRQMVACKRLAKQPMIFLAKRRQMRRTLSDKGSSSYTDENAGIHAASIDYFKSSPIFRAENEPENFDDYTQLLEDALSALANLKLEEYESETALSVLRFLENLINQPKEWISGAKLKLSEMKFPETAMILMRNYKEKGYFIRRIVFVHSILLYSTMGNITDHEFDKEGLIRKQAADVGFIEFACDILNTLSYRETLKRVFTIETPEEISTDDFDNFQKVLYICDSALTILYNMGNLPELKMNFRDCNAVDVVVEYTKLSIDSIQIKIPATEANKDSLNSLKELQDIISAVRLTSSLLLTLIINEDEDNLVTMNNAEIFPLLSGMIQLYNQADQRFYGFSFIELVDGLSRIMVRGRTFKSIDQNLVHIFLKILGDETQEDALLECVSNAILNLSFDEKVQQLLEKEHATNIITSARDNCYSPLVRKNCEAILWTINRNPSRRSIHASEQPSSQSHIMISYNRSVLAMCLKIRDRLKALHYNVWLDVDNINGGVLESMADAIEKSFVVLICMNEQYKQSHYCRLEYATELRKPCIPCLMQPRFCPYGWLGIIKGAKIHVDFARLPFEEAFSLLIREVETIRFGKSIQPTSHGDPDAQNALNNFPVTSTGIPLNTNELQNTVRAFPALSKEVTRKNPIASWKPDAVHRWLTSIGLTHFEKVFPRLNGQHLWQLYQMKQSSPETYFKLIEKELDRASMADLCDILQFDSELDRLLG